MERFENRATEIYKKFCWVPVSRSDAGYMEKTGDFRPASSSLEITGLSHFWLANLAISGTTFPAALCNVQALNFLSG